jgi:hypothetical protein
MCACGTRLNESTIKKWVCEMLIRQRGLTLMDNELPDDKTNWPEDITEVIWGDGQRGSQVCALCFSTTCIKPSHNEKYRELVSAKARSFDEENPVI